VHSLIVKFLTRIFSRMAGVEPMLKMKREVHAAKPRAQAEDIRDIYRDTMKRYPKTMALLAE
jgi:hypothetical protein